MMFVWISFQFLFCDSCFSYSNQFYIFVLQYFNFSVFLFSRYEIVMWSYKFLGRRRRRIDARRAKRKNIFHYAARVYRKVTPYGNFKVELSVTTTTTIRGLQRRRRWLKKEFRSFSLSLLFLFSREERRKIT